MFKKIETLIIKIFSKKIFQFTIDIILHVILKLKGYKNFGSFKYTGEEYFLNFLSKNKVKHCLDIGAHNGEYSKKLLKIKNSKIIAFEPMKASFQNLNKIKNDFPNRFECFNVALSDKIGFQKIYFTNVNSQLASLTKNIQNINFLKKKKFKTKKINVITLDNFVKKNKYYFNKRFDFIKIDTEGNDLKVLKGGIQFIKKHKPKFIQIEMNYHYLFDGENLFQFHKLLKNYNIFKILPFNNGLIRIDVNRPENNIFHLSNFIFIKKGIDFSLRKIHYNVQNI